MKSAGDAEAGEQQFALTIDAEFSQLIQPLSTEELALLERHLLSEGCRDPLLVWDDGRSRILLDGHNRFEICQRHDLPYKVEKINLPGRDAARRWISEHQLGRRNLTPEAQAYLRGCIYNMEKKQGTRTDLETSRHSGEKSSERLANLFGSTSRTIERDSQFAARLDQLAEAVGPDIKHAVLTRDARITRTDVARLLKLEASIRDRIIARVRDGEKAAPLIKEASSSSAGASEQPVQPVRTAASGAPVEDSGHGASQVEEPTTPMQPQSRAGESPPEDKERDSRRAAEDGDGASAPIDPVTELVVQFGRLSEEDRARFLQAINFSSRGREAYRGRGARQPQQGSAAEDDAISP